MRGRVSHRHRRGAACLLCLLAGLPALMPPPGAGALADDAPVNQASIDTGVQAGSQAGSQADEPVGEQTGDHANQLFILGRNRESGEWVRPDPVEAYMWYLLAAMAGHDSAPTARERIATEMTVEQIAAAWSRAGRCLATGYLYCDDAEK